MDNWVTSIIGQLGYGGVALLMFLENLFPPIPSEVIMPVAGVVAAKGELELSLVIATGAAYQWIQRVDSAHEGDSEGAFGAGRGPHAPDVAEVRQVLPAAEEGEHREGALVEEVLGTGRIHLEADVGRVVEESDAPRRHRWSRIALVTAGTRSSRRSPTVSSRTCSRPSGRTRSRP